MRWLHRLGDGWLGVRERLRALVFRSREEHEMDEELRYHLEMETEANLRRGLSPEEARRRALVAFGGVERFKEEVRDARGFALVERIGRDARQAVRRLRREPGFAVPVVAVLALGIGVTTAVFALVHAILLAPLSYRDADRLVAVGHAASGVELPMTGLSPGTLEHYRAHNRVFDEIGVYMDGRLVAMTDGDTPEQLRIAMVSATFFPVLQVRPMLGRVPVAADYEVDRTGVLLSHDLWVRRYGADPTIVGRMVEVERVSNPVVGVAEPGFHFPGTDTQAWMVYSAARNLQQRAMLLGLYQSGVARLKPGVTVQNAERDLARLVRALPEAFPDVTAQQLDEMGLRATVTPLEQAIVGDVRAALLLLLGTAGFLLVITWANATNLSLVRAERMRREVAVARALGAGAGDLARRFLCESILLATTGGALGLALAWAAVTVRFGFAPGDLPRLDEVTMTRTTLAVGGALSLASATLLAAVSLFAVRRPNVAAVLAGGSGRATPGRDAQLGRRLLVTGQVALALTLLTGSALMAESFRRLEQVRLGFEPRGALTFYLPIPRQTSDYHQAARLHHDVLTRLRALPGVDAVAAGSIAAFPLTTVPPYYNARVTATESPARDSTDAPYTLFGFATPNYFRAMGIPLLRGRTFERVDTSRERPGVVLSAALARTLFGDADPVGRTVRWAGRTSYPPYTVVGVAGDVPGETIRHGPSKVLYFPNLYPPQADTVTRVVHHYFPSDEMYVVRTSLPSAALVPAIREAIRLVDPKLAMTRVSSLDDVVAASLARARLTMLLLLVASATALALGMIGIYGVLAYAVAERTPELGVRIALGAAPGRVVRMVVRQGAQLALAGIVVGTMMAVALTRFLRGLLYEVSPTDPRVLGGVAALLFVVALAASYLPARRAGRIDPVRALKGG